MYNEEVKLLDAIIVFSKLIIVKSKLVDKVRRHLLDLVVRKDLKTIHTNTHTGT